MSRNEIRLEAVAGVPHDLDAPRTRNEERLDAIRERIDGLEASLESIRSVVGELEGLRLRYETDGGIDYLTLYDKEED